MTKPHDPEALLSAYLADGMEVLPDRVVDSVLDEIHRTRQRAVLGPWRTRSVFKTALGAAAVVAVVALGGALYVIQPGLPTVAGPSPTRSADPSPSLRGVVAPSSTPSRPSDVPTSSAVPGPAGVWIATGTMETPRYDHTAVRLVDGRVLVAGGSGAGADGGNDLTSAELYDPASGTWSATGNMVSSAGLATATLLRDGKVLVVGSRGAQLYDPDSGTWTATGKMTTPRYNHTATLLPDGRVFVAGGDVYDVATNSAELYDPDTGSWTAIANTRFDSSPATLLQDGTVLFLRGSTPALYDPATGTWTATGDMARPGTPYGSATRLLDGRVLVAGGRNGNDAAETAEVYDPATGSWTKTGSMLRTPNSGGDGTRATLLLDGTVLVEGGSVAARATGSAELYIPADVSPPPNLAPVPSPTASPTASPIPTPFPPEAGPVPTDARPWKVTVVNKSSVTATLFLAEDGENGIGQLCGSVTPNVVPAGVTEKVTFLLPPTRVKSCWIWVDPVPGQGGSLFQTSDAPLAGEILIQEGERGAQGGWLSP